MAQASLFTSSQLDASTIILGFTGAICSGSTFISYNLSQQYGFHYFKLSDILREILKNRGHTEWEFNIDFLQNKGNELRAEEQSRSLLVQKLIEHIEEDGVSPSVLIVDGIKNIGEVEVLKSYPNFYLFSVHAPFEKRRNRALQYRIVSNSEEFETIDNRDQKEENEYGQQVKYCNYLSDIIVINDNEYPHTSQDLIHDYIQDNIYRRYVSLIINSANKESYHASPTIDELCMTTAYALSKKSSCIKRKVGAVIVDFSVNGIHHNSSQAMGTTTTQTTIQEIPFIISSGYNEVPIGETKCIYDQNIEGCYRDRLQEQFFSNINNCPNCGTSIDFYHQCICGYQLHEFRKKCPSCNKEIKQYICEACGKDIVENYIPGGKSTPGKLLDVCRAVHAEENAILNLTRYGGSKNDLVLYTTTYPCNLCANKIVNAGIKKVVYAEPYTMPEAERIFDNYNVIRQRFQGIKSSAYFKLY
jgi:deoxycytidylate deaminase